MPSAALEEYLETIYKLGLEGEVRPSQIADALGVAPPTVTAGLRRLESAGLIARPDGGVTLTAEGVREAVAIVRRHRIAVRFLVDALGLPWDAAHEEACVLEHALSDRVLSALETFLDNPAVCPHGHPIPDRDGAVTSSKGVALSELAPGRSSTIVSVPEDEDLLGYIESLHLRPGQRVSVEDAAPFDGPLLIDVDGRKAAIDRGIARRILVGGDGS
jgi:DtxR family Mn-dependent transcriptional regulator